MDCERGRNRVLRTGCLLLSVALAASCGAERPRPSVLLVTIDTLRADALGVYGARPSPSPSLDALATEATLFERAYTPLPMTRPAHFSMFTSRYPREHGVLNNKLSLPDAEQTLAEVLRESGYRTGAFVAVALLSRKSGAGQGFEVLEPPARRQRRADGVVDDALTWLQGLGPSEPFFAWVHLFDPHQPYEQPVPGLVDVDAGMLRAMPSLEWPDFYRVAAENGGDVPRPVFEHALSLYRSEVAYADREVGRLLAGLGALRSLDDVVVVVTADHGECFEDGVFFEHSDCLLEGALHVPLLVRYPARFAPGSRVADVVSHIDIGPTVLTAAGLPVPERFEGTPLRGRGGAASPTERAERNVLVQYPFYQTTAVEGRLAERRVIETVAGMPAAPVAVDEEKVGVVGAGWKYLRSGAREELYRVGSDADEQRDRSRDEAAVRDRLAGELDAQLEGHPLTVLDAGEINEELRETLEALGYVQ
jgi:arylsulfatase A-like enzyme